MEYVYLLIQERFCEGNFGDLENMRDEIHGVFSSLESAELAKSKINQPIFNAQFGKAEEECEIIKLEIKS